MTISTPPSPLSYSGDDSTTDFAVSWKYLAKSHIVATLRSSTGTETTWVLDTDFTLTAAGSTGTLTATSAPATNETLVITLEPPYTQGRALPLGGDFPSTKVEDALDQQVQLTARLKALLDRSFTVPKTDTRSGSQLETPNETDRASKFFAWDSSGDPIAAVGTSADLTPVSSFINDMLDDADADTVRTTIGVTYEDENIIISKEVFS